MIIGSGWIGSEIGRKNAISACKPITTVEYKTRVEHVCSEKDLRIRTEVWQNALWDIYGDYLDCITGRPNRWSMRTPRSGSTSRTDYRECSSLLGMLEVAVAIELIFLLRFNV